MGNFRFYRRQRIFPGLSLNWSGSGPSLTVGARGMHATIGHGRIRRTVGIPGTGLYWTSTEGQHTGLHSGHVETPVAPSTHWVVHLIADLCLLAFSGLVALLALSAFILTAMMKGRR